jgi:maleate cis-trans isomerase
MNQAAPVYGRRGRIGLLVPANNSVIEPEFWSVLPEGLGLYATRLLVKGDLTPELVHGMEAQVGHAVETIAATGVDVIAYCDMVTTFIMEPGWNEAAVAKIASNTGVKAISAWTSLRDALGALGVKRFALGTPYPARIHAIGLPFLRSRGYEITADATLDILATREVPTVDRARLQPFVDSLDVSRADALVLLATDLPTFGVIAEIEQKIGRPVVTSNQALLWSAMRALGLNDRIAALGKLFTT